MSPKPVTPEDPAWNALMEHWLHPRHPGPMERPDGHAREIGECGDVLEIFLRVREGRIEDASFMTDGCMTTLAVGSAAVELALGRHATEAARIGAGDILDALGGLPADHEHCAELAARTLRAAIADYRQGLRDPWKKIYRPVRG
jgi:nitrogen fixation NifU-like protein